MKIYRPGINLFEVCKVIKEIEPTNVVKIAKHMNESQRRVRYAVHQARRHGWIRNIPHTYQLVVVQCGEETNG